jgi:hypothetical protein
VRIFRGDKFLPRSGGRETGGAKQKWPNLWRKMSSMKESRRILRFRDIIYDVIYDVTYGRANVIYGRGTSSMGGVSGFSPQSESRAA